MEEDDKLTDVDAPPDRHDDPIEIGDGTDIGGYIIDGELGRGGMGVVYSATHPVIGKRAAIKVLRAKLSKQPIAVERFIQEARAVNQIGHPNIVDIFAFDRLPDGRAYLVMDLLDGESLRKRLRRGPCHVSEGASIIDEISSALIAAHDKGFVHRDLKPDNVFLVAREGRWPEVKLLDFGLAKLVQPVGDRPFTTKTGVLLGTPDYMSPEQARGKDVDQRTDIYALGVLTFEILGGKRPFPKADTPFETLQAHVEQMPASLADLCPTLPPEIIQLSEAMLAKEPDDRPSLAAVRTVIKRLRSNTVIPTMSVASLEISLSSPKIAAAPPAEPLGLTASRVGAEPLVPSAAQPVPRPPSSPGSTAASGSRHPSSPGASSPASSGSRHPSVAPSSPGASGSKWPSTVPGTMPGDLRRKPSQPPIHDATPWPAVPPATSPGDPSTAGATPPSNSGTSGSTSGTRPPPTSGTHVPSSSPPSASGTYPPPSAAGDTRPPSQPTPSWPAPTGDTRPPSQPTPSWPAPASAPSAVGDTRPPSQPTPSWPAPASASSPSGDTRPPSWPAGDVRSPPQQPTSWAPPAADTRSPSPSSWPAASDRRPLSEPDVRSSSQPTPSWPAPAIGTAGPAAATAGVQPQSSGLSAAAGSMRTKFGVPPQPKVATVARAIAKPATSRRWIVIGALVAIAAGIAIALIVTAS